MLTSCQLDLQVQISVKFESKYYNFHSRKGIWKFCLYNVSHFVQGSQCLVPNRHHAKQAPSHYLNQCWIIVNWNPRNKFQWNLDQNTIIFIQENAIENVVCQMSAILSRLSISIHTRIMSQTKHTVRICQSTLLPHKTDHKNHITKNIIFVSKHLWTNIQHNIPPIHT